MKLVLLSAAMAATAVPAAPALAHCRTVHHRVHHAAAQVRVRHHPVHHASRCGCATRVAHRSAVYRPVYQQPRIVEVTYERPLPRYRPYRIGYAVPLYRPRPIFYRGGFDRRFHHRWAHDRFEGRHRRWGGWR
jgi:hypothetical protein